MKVLVYPQDPNPYQELLYRKFEKDVVIKYLVDTTKSHTINMLLLPLQLLRYRFLGYDIFHLHWLYKFQFPAETSNILRIFTSNMYFIYTTIILLIIRAFNYKLVWTVHDLVPHEKQFRDDLLMSKILAILSSAKIVHSTSTIADMKAAGVSTRNTYVVPIGNYISVYENSISKFHARKLLHIDTNDFVYGFFGRVEEYKGIIPLVKTFNKLELPHTKLLIAGPCVDKTIEEFIVNAAQQNPNIILFLDFIKNTEMQKYINSSDIVVYPFKKITTSSSVLLAMSFSRTVIATKVGEIKDIPEYTGFYINEINRDLATAMHFVYDNKKLTEKKSICAYKWAEEHTWEKSSKLTYDIYKTLVKSK